MSSPPAAGEPDAAVRALQRAVIDALRQGAELSTVHKEGGTVIRHDGRGFIAADFGDQVRTRRFPNDDALLAFLWNHFAFVNARDLAPEPLTPEIGWRMIRDRLRTPAAHGASDAVALSGKGAGAVVWTAAIGALALAGVLGYLKFHPKADAVRGEASPARLQGVSSPPQITQPPRPTAAPAAGSGARP